ncbi:transcription factor WhiB [Kribbella rubisoli]|uniref:Transcriptional regulator WhiB n=1 Tax=Kribbella rubisoli TaxID=3075929 RepID=A0A4Q7XB30_9ACTN|nr:WhiB family transcriptional regulator [Kribbella rubisoli]RZU20053.1 transcription factor WhiB [Kribbella rubisoli]
MKVHEIPGQLELVFETPTLTLDQRAEISAYIVSGWQGMGECRSVADDSCFPEPGQATSAAVDRCGFCPVRRSCLASALANDEEFGVWGGTTEVQRDVIRTDIAAGVPIVDALDRSTLLPELLWRQAS